MAKTVVAFLSYSQCEVEDVVEIVVELVTEV